MIGETELSAVKGGGAGSGLRDLRVDLLTPAYWPEVRRGTERFTHELAHGLLARGQRPRILTSHPGGPARAVEEGVPVVRVPRPPDARMRRRMWEDYMSHIPLAYAALRVSRPQIAHAMHVSDAAAAARYSRHTGAPALLSFMGIPDHDDIYQRRKRLDLFLAALEHCAAVVALSRAAQEGFMHWFGYEARVIPPGANLQTFTPGSERSAEPTIVCSADITEVRKNVPLLIAAFSRVRKQRPGARLLLSRPRDLERGRRIVGDAEGVELVDLDDRGALNRAYGEAWVSVLASVREAFGLVLVEALACGTPVVGTAADGISEIIDRPEVGRTFTADDEEDLARALLEALELAGDPSTRANCRARAEDFSTERTTDLYLDLYQELL